MVDSVAPITSATAARYRYYLVDITSNSLIGEIPLEDVGFTRGLREAGSFDGKITVGDQTSKLDLYNSTMPGRTAVFVVRNDTTCVWGGIIWSRSYDLTGRSLNFTASEFQSYLNKRYIWKTHSFNFTASVTKNNSTGFIYVSIQGKILRKPLDITDSNGNANQVYITFSDTSVQKYNGFYDIGSVATGAPSNPTNTGFYVKLSQLPAPKYGAYTDVSIASRTDTYDYTRELLGNVFNDFTDIDFANRIIEPGVAEHIHVTNYSITKITNTTGTATITTEYDHNLAPGQRVDLANIHELLDGKQVITSIGSPTTFTVNIKNPKSRSDKVTPIDVVDVASTATTNNYSFDAVNFREIITETKKNIKSLKRSSGVVTITLTEKHKFKVNDKIQVTVEKKAPAVQTISGTLTNTFDYSKYVDVVTITGITSTSVTFADPHFTDSKYDLANTAVADSSKNYVVGSAPETRMKLSFTKGTGNGYRIGEKIKVSGVDAPGWGQPYYDGYVEVDDLDNGPDRTITYYSIDSGSSLATIYFGTTDPGFSKGDFFTVTSANADINGYHKALCDSTLDNATDNPNDIDGFTGYTNKYFVTFKKDVSADVAYTAVSGSTAAIDGSNWITFNPAYDAIAGLSQEPNSTINFVDFTFKEANGADPNKITLTTSQRHGFSIGDKVKIVYTNDKDQTDFGFDTATISGVGDYDSITYSLPASKASKQKNSIDRTTKKGAITRYKAKLGQSPVVDVDITGIWSDGTVATVYSPDHDLNVGDYVSLHFLLGNKDTAGNDFAYYDNGGDPVKITQATKDTFSYVTGLDYPATSRMIIKGIDFSTDKNSLILTAVNAKINGTPSTYAISSVQANSNYTIDNANKSVGIFTLSGSTSAISVGDYVTVSGLVDVAKSTSTTSAVTRNITRIEYKPSYYNAMNGNVLLYYTKTSDSQTAAKKGDTVTLANFSTTTKDGTIYTYGITSDDYKKPLSTNQRVLVDDEKYDSLYGYYITVPVSGQYTQAFTIASPSLGQTLTIPGKTFTYAGKAMSDLNTASGRIAKKISGTQYVVVYSKANDWADTAVTGFPTFVVTPNIQDTTTAPAIKVGDLIDITGFTDGTAITNKYSLINRQGYKIKSIVTSSLSLADGRKAVKFTVSSFLPKVNKVRTTYTPISLLASENISAIRYNPVVGAAYLDYTRIDSNVSGITAVSRNAAGTLATITSPGHGYVTNDKVYVWVYYSTSGSAIGFNNNNKPIAITRVDADNFSYPITVNTTSIEYINVQKNFANLYTKADVSHGFHKGDTITLSGFTGTYSSLNGSKKIVEVSTTTIKVAAASIANTNKVRLTGSEAVAFGSSLAISSADAKGIVMPAPTITREPMCFVHTYGEYPNNSNIGGIDFSDTSFSTYKTVNDILRGSDMVNVADHLQKYSGTLVGFDYRIDCSVYKDTSGTLQFKKTFVFIPTVPPSLKAYLNSLPVQQTVDAVTGDITYEHRLGRGQWAPPSAFGADKIVFEYPGNILNASLSESADSSATRVFVMGNNAGAGGGDAYYSAASAGELLQDGWPLLEKLEKQDYPLQGLNVINVDNWGGYDTELDLAKTAKRVITESKPPVGDFLITVNGSMSPLIGSYNPGDWCSIIVNDNYIKNRLNSKLEPRKDVIIRKIDAIKVTVPNNPAFPEQIDLTLVTDWQVDKVGQ
jgi:hypothetical protein